MKTIKNIWRAVIKFILRKKPKARQREKEEKVLDTSYGASELKKITGNFLHTDLKLQ